jgi:hypothetical protein
MIKKAMAPKIGTPITIRAQITFGVEDKFLFLILTREIIDKTGQDTSSRILIICKTIVIEKFIFLPL